MTVASEGPQASSSSRTPTLSHGLSVQLLFRTRVLGPALLLNSCVTLGELPTSLSLSFPNEVLQGCCE